MEKQTFPMEKTTADMSNLQIDSTDDSSDRKLLIAVDFGTTYSGVAWAQTRRVGQALATNKRTAIDIIYSPMFKPSSYNGPTLLTADLKV